MIVAGVFRRLFAAIIDSVVLGFFSLMLYWDNFLDITDVRSIVIIISHFAPVLILLDLFYQTFFVWYCSATPGKIITKIVCLDKDTLVKPRLWQSLLRALVRLVSFNLFYIGCIWILTNKSRRAWHDYLANTVVLHAQ